MVGPTAAKPITPLIKSFEARFAHQDTSISRLAARWEDIVGATIGKICEPIKIVKSRTHSQLEVRVAGAYAALLQHQSAVLIDRINLFLGTKDIDKLRFVQGPLSERPQTITCPRPKPLNASEELALKQLLDDVIDENLRKTLNRLGRAVLQIEKSSVK
jgi:hypothetical protein